MTPDLSYYWEGGREQCEDSKWNITKGKKKMCISDAYVQPPINITPVQQCRSPRWSSVYYSSLTDISTLLDPSIPVVSLRYDFD